MKMTRKLIPALVMLLVSAIMLSTASYAWFATNDTVYANDMSVTARSTARFLEISTNSTSGYQSSAAATSKSKTVDLVHAKITDNTNISWYLGISDAADNKGTTNTTPLVGGIGADGGNYALVNTFYVRMSEGSAIGLTNLTVTGATFTGTSGALDPALRILVVGDDGAQIFRPVAAGTKVDGVDYKLEPVTIDGSTNASSLVSSIPVDGTAKTITVYVYFDGDDAAATTNNTNSLGAMTVTVEFTAIPA